MKNHINTVVPHKNFLFSFKKFRILVGCIIKLNWEEREKKGDDDYVRGWSGMRRVKLPLTNSTVSVKGHAGIGLKLQSTNCWGFTSMHPFQKCGLNKIQPILEVFADISCDNQPNIFGF